MDIPVRILITGRPGSGKTTAVERVVEGLDRPAGGFITRELRDDGSRVGFELRTLSGERAVMAHVEFDTSASIGRYGVDVDVIERVGVKAVRSAIESDELVVVDEIGPMELLSDAFRGVVLDALDADVPFVGTVVARSHPFTDGLKDRPDTELIRLNHENRDHVPAEVLRRIFR